MAAKRVPNNLTKFREDRLMSKAELARAAGISPLTVDRVEKGYNCRLSTKRKIVKALGMSLEAAHVVFPSFQPASNGDAPKEEPIRPAESSFSTSRHRSSVAGSPSE